MTKFPCRSSLIFALSCMSAHAFAQGKPMETAIGVVQTSYTCKDADEIKFNREKYDGLSLDDRVILDAQWNRCDLAKRRQAGRPTPDDEPVLMANPAPTRGSSKVFYGTVKRKDLENANKNCQGAGKAGGITLQVVGAGTGVDEMGLLGRAVYNYSGVSCEAMAGAIAGDNAMVIIAPAAIIAEAAKRKFTGEILKTIPFLSDADEREVKKLLDKTQLPPIVVGKDGVKIGGKKICCKL